jgi:uncharacterized protein (DUF433 family)
METPTIQKPERVEIPTEHPHVVWREDTFRKKLVIRGSRIQVWLVASLFKHGDKPEDILSAYPFLNLAAIYDAISYYLDHAAEIDAEIESNKPENVLKELNAHVDNRGFVIFDDLAKNE